MRYVGSMVLGDSPRARVTRTTLILVLIAAIALTLSLPALAQNKYVIRDGDDIIVCMSSSDDPQVVLQEAGLTLGESDTFTTQKNAGVSEIHITRVQMVSIYCDGQMIVAGTYGETVEEVLASVGISVTDTDQVSCSLDMATYDGLAVRINRIRTEVVEYEQVVPHVDEIYEDATLEPGEEVVLSEGRDGLSRCTAEITYKDGEEVSRKILSRLVVTAPADGLILRGVDRSVKEQENSGDEDYRLHYITPVTPPANSTQTDALPYIPGTTQTFRGKVEFVATAYSCDEEVGITASGTMARVGAIAVDPRVIPLGTQMYIVSTDGQYVYGYCTAEDTGSAIKGNIVDLYYDSTEEANLFGRRNVTIYFI